MRDRENSERERHRETESERDRSIERVTETERERDRDTPDLSQRPKTSIGRASQLSRLGAFRFPYTLLLHLELRMGGSLNPGFF